MASNPIDYNPLSAQERLRLIEAIWDTFGEEPESLPFTEGQREGLHRDRSPKRWRDRT